MNGRVGQIIRYYVRYIILLLIFKNIHYLLPISLDSLSGWYTLAYIPICYLVVRFMFIYDLEKNNYLKKYYLVPIFIGYTIFNFLFSMPIIYDICIALFLIILRGPLVVDEVETWKNIATTLNNRK